MWYVEAQIGDQFERWEGLTQEQSTAVLHRYYDQGNGFVRSGQMNVENPCGEV